MKLTLFYLALPILIILSFGSCNYSNIAEVIPINDSNVAMSANTGGVSYVSYNGSTYQGIGSVSLHAITNNNRELQIDLHNYDGTRRVFLIGTATAGVDTSTGFYVENGKTHNSLYGTVTLTEISPYYRGTFKFTCTDSTVVDSGYFKVRAN